MTQVCLESVPKPRHWVRKRRFDERCLLVSRGREFEIDSLTENVWRRCDGRASIREIAAQLARAHEMSQRDAEQKSLSTILFLNRIDLLEVQ